jgi:hypothetical protein
VSRGGRVAVTASFDASRLVASAGGNGADTRRLRVRRTCGGWRVAIPERLNRRASELRLTFRRGDAIHSRWIVGIRVRGSQARASSARQQMRSALER